MQSASICSLTSNGGISYSLSGFDLRFNGSLSILPSQYVGAVIQFYTLDNALCGKDIYVCLIDNKYGKYPLCGGPPQGSFINQNFPQLGPTFSCSYASNVRICVSVLSSCHLGSIFRV